MIFHFAWTRIENEDFKSSCLYEVVIKILICTLVFFLKAFSPKHKCVRVWQKLYVVYIWITFLGDVTTQVALQAALKFNGGGHINHTIFWTNLSPNGGGEPQGKTEKFTKIETGFWFFLFFYSGEDIELKTNRRTQNVSVRYMSIYVTVN